MYIGHGVEKERRKRGREEEGGIRQRKTGKGRADVSKGRWSEERIDECHSRQPFVDRSCAQVLKHCVLLSKGRRSFQYVLRLNGDSRQFTGRVQQ
jgi:hypothetical protein